MRPKMLTLTRQEAEEPHERAAAKGVSKNTGLIGWPIFAIGCGTRSIIAAT